MSDNQNENVNVGTTTDSAPSNRARNILLGILGLILAAVIIVGALSLATCGGTSTPPTTPTSKWIQISLTVEGKSCVALQDTETKEIKDIVCECGTDPEPKSRQYNDLECKLTGTHEHITDGTHAEIWMSELSTIDKNGDTCTLELNPGQYVIVNNTVGTVSIDGKTLVNDNPVYYPGKPEETHIFGEELVITWLPNSEGTGAYIEIWNTNVYDK